MQHTCMRLQVGRLPDCERVWRYCTLVTAANGMENQRFCCRSPRSVAAAPGAAAYLEMILHVMGLGHPVISVEFRGVAMRLGKVYTADEVADSVAGILDKLNVKEACVVGHSYGALRDVCIG
eukprot:GHRQ01019014.1.p1 GENE.GHRQ01019014.1~~GHRQ01019014.1.p1  ORF type:complete len:122 (-),score=14.02 GHRQ01019014.1:643-1008(-)